MANTLGSLVVTLGLDAASFTSGLSRAEYDAQKFAESLERDLQSAAKGVGVALGLVATAAVAAFAVLKREVEVVASFKQLSEQIGDTAQNVASLQKVSATSGIAMDAIADASIKLTASLSKTDDESKGAANALKQIGINLNEFLKLSPVQQLEAIARALDNFEDGAGKTAFAVAAFGKAGAAVLPFLNDLAAAGERQIKLTDEQIARADAYTKELARNKAAFNELLQVVAVESLPAFVAFTGALNDTIKALIGVDEKTKTLTGNDVKSWALAAAQGLGYIVDAGQGAATAFVVLGKAIGGSVAAREAFFKGDFSRALTILKETTYDIAKAYNALDTTFSDRLKARMGLADAMQMGPPAPGRPKLDPKSFAIPSAAAGKVDEFAKALESANKQAAVLNAEFEALNRGEEDLTQTQKTLIALMASKTWEEFSENERETVRFILEGNIAIEKSIEALKKRGEEYRKYIDDLQKQAEAEAKARERVRDSVTAYAEQTEIIKRYTAIIGQDQLAHEKLAAAIEYENLVKKAKEANDLASIANLEKEYQARLKVLEAQDAARKQNEEIQKSKQFVDDLAKSFANAAEDAIVMGKSFKDVMKGLEQDILRIVTRRLVTEPLANMLGGFLGGMGAGNIGAGAAGAGTDWGALAAKFILGLFGGGTGPGIGAGTAGSNIPAGPYPYASGTDYARGGLSLVGERGPELMYVPRGAQIIPHNELVTRRNSKSVATVNQYITVQPGASKATADQVAAIAMRRARQAGRIL